MIPVESSPLLVSMEDLIFSIPAVVKGWKEPNLMSLRETEIGGLFAKNLL